MSDSSRASSQQLTLALAAILIALSTGSIVAYATRWGPWAYSDGVGYLSIARNLLAGVGLGLVKPSGEFELLVSHPPLYPLLLAGLAKLGLDLISAARWIDILCAAALAGATTVALSRRRHSLLWSVYGGLLLALTPAVFLLHVSAMAEPLFLLFAFSCLYLLIEHLANDNTWTLVASGLAAALATLTRYPGVAFALAAWLSIATHPSLALRERLMKIALHAAISLPPVGLFLLLAGVLSGGGSPKGVSSPSADLMLEYFKKAATVFWEWKPVPSDAVLTLHWPNLPATGIRVALVLAMTFALLMIVVLWLSRRQRASEQARGSSPWIRSLLLLILTYFLLYALAFLLTAPTPDVDQRTLLPILPATLLLLLQLSRRIASGSPKPRALSLATAALWAGIGLGFAPSTYDMVTGFHRTGGGYTSPTWRASQTIDQVGRLPEDLTLVSNHPEAVLLLIDRYPHDTESLLSQKSLLDDACRQELGAFVRKKDAVLILFREGLGTDGAESWPEVWARIGRACELELLMETGDGALFVAPENPLLETSSRR